MSFDNNERAAAAGARNFGNIKVCAKKKRRAETRARQADVTTNLIARFALLRPTKGVFSYEKISFFFFQTRWCSNSFRYLDKSTVGPR